MRLFSYVVARDFGFAPNPFYRVCTLATCKPKIRATAEIGDWITGTGSKKHQRQDHLVYVMQVTGAMTFNEYWASPRFQNKKPNLRGSVKQGYGDNIYYKVNDTWQQLNSHHSFSDGTQNTANVRTDTSVDRILFADTFAYWGGIGPSIPSEFLSGGAYDTNICAHRGHKSNLSDDVVSAFVNWFLSLDNLGFLGKPLDWK